MSLVHESFIDLLDRRFVSCYFNAFPGHGSDPDRAELKRKYGHLRYGAILTPDGRLLKTFGFDLAGFRDALLESLEAEPRLARYSDDEESILARGRAPGATAADRLAAARVEAELLKFDSARQFLAAVNAGTGTTVAARDLSRARFWSAHYTALEHQLFGNHPEARQQLAALENLPDDLADDAALDLISLDVELDNQPGFYTGWKLKRSVDAEALEQTLTDWIAKAPDSNRIGQMHFYLGLAHKTRKQGALADATWHRHFDTWPEDRFAMLSRIHHSSYPFSPYKVGGGGVIIDRRGRGEMSGGGRGSGRFPKPQPRPTLGDAQAAADLELSGNTRETGILDQIGIPEMLAPTLLDQLEKAGMAGIPVQITLLHGDKTPISGAELAVHWDNGKLTRQTDRNGVARFTITPAMAHGLELEFPEELDARIESTVGVSSGGTSQPGPGGLPPRAPDGGADGDDEEDGAADEDGEEFDA